MFNVAQLIKVRDWTRADVNPFKPANAKTS